MTDKKLKISVQTDLKDGKKLTEFLNQIAASGNKVAKSLAGVAGGGSIGMKQSALGKALLEQKALFKDLGKDSTNLARILKDQVGRSADDLAKKYKNIRNELKGAIAEHTRLEREFSAMQQRRSAGDNSVSARDFHKMEGRLGRSGARIAGMAGSANQAQMEYMAAMGGRGQAGAAGGLGGGGQDGIFRNFMGGLGLRQIGAAGAALWVGNQLRQMPTMLMKEQSHTMQLRAREQDVFGTMGVRAREGELSDALAIHSVMTQYNTAGTLQEVASRNKLKNLERLAKSGVGINNILYSGREIPMEMTEEIAQLLELEKRADPNKFAKAAAFQSKAGSWVQHMRTAGGRGGFNSAARAGRELGFDENQTMSMFSTVMQQAGRRAAHSLMPKALSAVAAGMAEGTAAAIATGGAASGTNLLGLTGGLAGQTGIVAAGQIGQMVSQSIMSGNAITSGAGLMKALSAGVTNDPAGMVAMQQNVAAMGTMSAVFGGTHDPYRRAIGFANAISAVGKDASPHVHDVLLKAAQDPRILADLARGEVPPELRNMGVTPDMAKDFARRQQRSLLAGYVGGLDPKTKAGKFVQKAVDEFGGDFFSLVNKETKGMTEAQVNAYSRERGGIASSLFGVDLGEGSAIIRMGTAFGKGATKKGGFGDGSKGTAARGQLGTVLAREGDILDTYNKGDPTTMGMNKDEAVMTAVTQTMPQIIDGLTRLSSMGGKPEEVAKGLGDMAKAIDKVSEALRRGKHLFDPLPIGSKGGSK